jgi:hypothetical protein
VSLALVMALSVSRLGQGQAREAGAEKSDVSGISLSRAQRSIVYACAVGQPKKKPMIVDHDITPPCVTESFVVR